MLTKDIATQIYTILKQPQLKYISQVFASIAIRFPAFRFI